MFPGLDVPEEIGESDFLVAVKFDCLALFAGDESVAVNRRAKIGWRKKVGELVCASQLIEGKMGEQARDIRREIGFFEPILEAGSLAQSLGKVLPLLVQIARGFSNDFFLLICR